MTEYTIRPTWNSAEKEDLSKKLIPIQEIDWSVMPKVTYEEIKTQIKSGDVIAYAGTSLKSKLLRIVTNSPISHVGIALILHDTLNIIHSNTEKGVCIDPLDKDLPFVWIQHSLQWTNDHFLKCIKVLPAGYDLKSIILTGILNTKLSKPQPIPLKKHFMCSDLVSFIWDLHQENLLPQQILEWFMYNANGSAYFIVEEREKEEDNFIPIPQGEEKITKKDNKNVIQNNKFVIRRNFLKPSSKSSSTSTTSLVLTTSKKSIKLWTLKK